MPTAVADSYTTAAGGSIYAGRTAPVVIPLWLQGKPLNEWFQIPNTSVIAAGSAAQAFCGMALAEVGGKALCVVAAAGGHSDSFDNSVVSLDLMAATPAWTQRHASSNLNEPNVGYYSDGRPTSRHTYWGGNIYIPQLDRVLLPGVYGAYGSAINFPKVDAFNLNTYKWDGVVVDQPGISGSGYPNMNIADSMTAAVLNPATGDLWQPYNYFSMLKWSLSTKQQTVTANFSGNQFQGPGCWDPVRNQCVWFGRGSGGVMTDAWIVNSTGTSRQSLTFSASSALTEMANISATDTTENVVYDPVADKFYWFAAQGNGAVFVITPNAGTTWSVSKLTQGAGTIVPPNLAFTYSRFAYVASLNGLVFVPAIGSRNDNVHFMRLR